MGLLSDLSGGTSVGSNGSVNSASNQSYNNANSWSQTYANIANAFSAEQAELAYNRTRQLQREAMEYNAREAQKARDYNTEMANTIYTRSMKNMKEAGINPILAANLGLSAASVGSGQTASISGASAPMAQSFMDTSSASSSAGESYGSSNGSSWGSNYSESGLATGLHLMGQAIADAIGSKNAANASTYIIEKAGDLGDSMKGWAMENLPNWLLQQMGWSKDASSKTQSTGRKKTITGHTKIQGNGNNKSSGGGRVF